MDSPDAVPLPSPDPSPTPARPAGVRRDRASFTPAPARRTSTGIHFPTGPFAPLAHALMLLGATAAVFLAGKPQQGSMGIFLVCAGLAMVACPPRIAVSWRLWAAAAGLAGCAALALLPEHLVTQPAWRHALETTPPIVLPGTISTVPALTGFWLAALVISLLAGLFLLAQPLRSRWLLTLALLAATAVGAYAALAICARETGWHYPFSADTTFGFFPNRNHTADFLCVGCLLAVGVLGIVLREARWLAALLAGGVLAACAAGLMFFSESRAGIVFLLAGIGLWSAGLGRQHRDGRLVVSVAAVLVAGGILFLMAGGQARDRLLGKRAPSAVAPAAADTGGDEALHNLTTDFRLKIYRDTMDMIRDFPLTGMGLGTFPFVFPQYRRTSLVAIPVIHPESDWLMVAAEAGIPAAVCLLTLIVLAARQLRFEREHSYWPLRWGCAVAAMIAVLHGTVDVPMHRPQLGWWLLCVMGLAIQSARAGSIGRSRVQHALFVLGGLTALGMGCALVRAQWFNGPPLPPYAADGVQERVYEAFQHGDQAGARRIVDQALRQSPLYDPFYLQLGILLAQKPNADAGVDAAFKAQRLVNPIFPDVSLQQGISWFANDPDRTAALWLDALAREQRIQLARGNGSDGVLLYYRDLVRRGAEQPDTQNDLWNATRQNPAYALAWLETAEPDLVRAQFASVATDENFLGGLDDRMRRRFLLDWQARGDRAALQRFIDGRAGWEKAAWPVRVRAMADAGQFEALVREVSQRDGISLALPEANPSQTSKNSHDGPAAEFAGYWNAGNTVTARRVLDEAVAVVPGSGSAELWRLKAAVSASDADWKTAWSALDRVVQITHPDELP